MRWGLLLACSLALVGCAALLNSNRPRYHGPIVKAAWHNSSIHVDRKPVIHDGVVYVVGMPFGGREFRRVYAFDLKSGKPLWENDFPVDKILLTTGSLIFLQENGGRPRLLDAKSGKDLKLSPLLAMRSATAADGVVYSVAGSSLEARTLESLQSDNKYLWHAEVPVTPIVSLPPVVAGGTVYVGSLSDFVLTPLKRAETGFYAFDAKSGALRWKWESRERKGAPFIEGFSADANVAYLWMNDKSANVFGFGVLISFDAATGKEKWNHTTSMYVPSCPGPLLLDSNTVLTCDYPPGKEGTRDEKGFLFQCLNRQNAAQVSEVQTPWKYSNGAVSNGMLFASDHQVHELLTENNNSSPDSWVSAVSLETGKELWRSETIELGVLTTPAAGDGMVVVGSEIFTFNSVTGKREVAGLWAWPAKH